MVYNSGGGRYWIAGLLVSVGIFAVLYFTVIKPTTDTANRAINQSLHQAHKDFHRAEQNAPNGQAQKQLSQAEKLTACLQDAGTDVSKVQDCQAKFTP